MGRWLMNVILSKLWKLNSFYGKYRDQRLHESRNFELGWLIAQFLNVSDSMNENVISKKEICQDDRMICDVDTSRDRDWI